MAALVLSANAHAFQSKVEILEQFDNLRMVAFISMEDIDNSPVWNPERGAPPLTIIDAIKAVRNFGKSSAVSGEIKEIELRPVPRHEKHWHYLIKVANDAMTSKYNVYAVLMDGKVIPAIIEPNGYK